jgi:putative YphP/YqiW family bacilliredoxin
MYPESLVAPMRQDLSSIGFQELKTPSDVDTFMNEKGTSIIVINSVCGCAAGSARPGVKKALELAGKKPQKLGTVFAGVDKEATQRAREYTLPYPPSSPAIAIFKDGELVHFVERHHIEGRNAEMIAQHLVGAFEDLL